MTVSNSQPLLVCSKSPWEPAIRREHAFAGLAAAAKHDVRFAERPMDIRALRRGTASGYLRGLFALSPQVNAPGEIRIVTPSTIVPGHRGRLSAQIEGRIVSHALAAGDNPCVVFSLPWHWEVVRRLPAARRVFDMTDDWTRLLPNHSAHVKRYLTQISEGTDEIIVVSTELLEHFPGRRPVLVRNGVEKDVIGESPCQVAPRTMVYVGTITERFDAPLVETVLRLLPTWRLEIVGQRLFGGFDDKSAQEFSKLLDLDQVVWHGAMGRADALKVLDRGQVAIIPNRHMQSRGQDSMKQYDYAARGKMIVSTPVHSASAVAGPPGIWIASDAESFARAVTTAADLGVRDGDSQRSWAINQTWDRRWPDWSRAVFGAQR